MEKKKKSEILLCNISSATIFYLLGNKIISWCWFQLLFVVIRTLLSCGWVKLKPFSSLGFCF